MTGHHKQGLIYLVHTKQSLPFQVHFKILRKMKDVTIQMKHVRSLLPFSQVAHNQRGRNASQANVGGLNIGSFNDRFRDAVLGGSPFATAQHQGWVTGLYTQSSAFSQVSSFVSPLFAGLFFPWFVFEGVMPDWWRQTSNSVPAYIAVLRSMLMLYKNDVLALQVSLHVTRDWVDCRVRWTKRNKRS